MTTVVRRVVAGLSANAFGQPVRVVIQLLSIPLFLRWWDIATYGVWLILSATPACPAMADVWQLPRTLPMATNQHIVLGRGMLSPGLAVLVLRETLGAGCGAAG